jgi:NNP family nitrate/nitrite transporter-like MFS transporter
LRCDDLFHCWRPDQERPGLNDTQFGLLVGTPILTGSLLRLILGVWSDQYGGRIVYTSVMLAAALATWLLTFAYDHPTFLLAGLGVGIAGGSFAVGIAYVSKWYPTEQQGTALGIFGAGNVGAAVTKFLAPVIMVAYGWKSVANIWALAIAVTAVIFWLTTKDDPQLAVRRRSGGKPDSLSAVLKPWPASKSGVSRSITSSCSAPSWPWRCGCRAI